jgi:hypothetical protein
MADDEMTKWMAKKLFSILEEEGLKSLLETFQQNPDLIVSFVLENIEMLSVLYTLEKEGPVIIYDILELAKQIMEYARDEIFKDELAALQ